MFLKFRLKNLFDRLLVLIPALAIGGALIWLIFSHFIIRALSDTRTSYSPEVLRMASARFPGSPQLHFRAAEARMAYAVSEESMLPEALEHGRRAVELSPWDYRYWRILGLLLEMSGDAEQAESSMRAAVRLAPQHSEANWALANILLRRGKLEESIEPFSRATRRREDLLRLSFDLIWQASNEDAGMLQRMTRGNPGSQLSLVQFFLSKSRLDDALSIFRGMDREARMSSLKSAEFIHQLISAKQFQPARALWLELVTPPGETPDTDQLVWNGGFESNGVKDYNHFDWNIMPSEYARIGIDGQVARNGSRSLKIGFAGRDTTRLRGEVRQLIVLKPGVRYHLECYAKAYDLIAPEGPRVAILGKAGDIIASSEPVAEGTTDWRLLIVDFTAPDDNEPKYVAVIRIPKYSYDDPTRGSVWFDDFTLVESLITD